MKRSLMTMLVTLFILTLVSSCATIPANYGGQQKRRIPPSQLSYPNEVLAMPDFKVSKGPWFDLVAFETDMQGRKESIGAPGHVQEMFDNMLNETRPMEMAMKPEIENRESAFLALGFWMNRNVNIHFRVSGLTLSLKNPQGKIVDVLDKGCLFVHYNGPSSTRYDSRTTDVTFNRTFNNNPDYKKKPNVIYVRLDPQYYNWELVALTLDTKKIVVASH